MDNMQPVMTMDKDGDKFWQLPCGKFHREDGPAAEWADGDNYWWFMDEIHRTDGPAIEKANGSKEWWLHGLSYTFNGWLEQTPGLTDKQKTFYRLKYSQLNTI
jgi:hypothetical protein